MYRYLLFDLDGTLTDSQEGIVKSARYAMEQLGDPPLDDVTMLQFLGPPLQESFRRFCGYDPEKTQRALAIFRGRYEPIGQFENRGTPGMAEALARLKAEGYVLAVASSKPRRWAPTGERVSIGGVCVYSNRRSWDTDVKKRWMVRSCSRMRRVRSVVDSSSYCIISATVFSLTRWPLRTTVSTAISRWMMSLLSTRHSSSRGWNTPHSLLRIIASAFSWEWAGL